MTKFKYILSILLLFVVVGALSAKTITVIDDLNLLREGDLLFVVADQGNAITDVTHGYEGMSIDHVAIFHRQGSSAFALEAISRGVVVTPIDSFLIRNTIKGGQPHVLVGRIKGDFNVKASVERAMKYVGKAYDNLFMPDDKEIYCSELVQKSYIDNKGKAIFKTIPMSFHDDKGNITKFWKRYYKKRGMTVPEGKPGTNPGDMSRQGSVEIIYSLF